jgi:hypothetical protein
LQIRLKNPSLFRSWELQAIDTDGKELYRQVNPILHKRPQHSIEFRSNGEFIQRDIASNGKVTARKGRFEPQDGLIIVRFPDDPYHDLILHITFKNGNILEVRK